MILFDKISTVGEFMQTLHSFYIKNKEKINKSFNTFKRWSIEVEELRNYLEIVTLNNKNKYYISNEKAVLDFFRKFN